jgi:hypothetical protein
MNADDLKKLTTESLKELAALLEQGRSERLIALLKTMGRFHRYSLHNVCLLCRARHKRHHADSRIMPSTRSTAVVRSAPDDALSLVRSA